MCACTEHAGAAPEARARRGGAAPRGPAPGLRPEGSRGASVVFVLGLTALLSAWLAPLAAPPLVVATLGVAAVAGRRQVPPVDTWLRRTGVAICLALTVLLAFGFVMGRLSAGA